MIIHLTAKGLMKINKKNASLFDIEFYSEGKHGYGYRRSAPEKKNRTF